MRVLVVGSGGREHALAWAIAASPLATKLFVPRRATRGRRRWPRTCRSPPRTSRGLVALRPRARDRSRGARARRRRWWPASPTRWPRPASPAAGRAAAAARLEGSKAFTKELCDEAGIPTARWERFDDAGRGARVRPPPRRADRGQGGRARRRQGRRRRRRPKPRPKRRSRAMMQDAPLRRRRRDGGDRGMPRPARSAACSRSATAPTRCSWASRATTSASATATPAPTPAAWARSRPCPASTRRRSWTRSSARRWPPWSRAARRSAASCSPG